jgi:hypothetical protein
MRFTSAGTPSATSDGAGSTAVAVPPAGLLEAGHEVGVEAVDVADLVGVVPIGGIVDPTDEKIERLLHVPNVLLLNSPAAFLCSTFEKSQVRVSAVSLF